MQRTPQSYEPAERARIMAAVRRGLEVGRRVGATARECGITEATYYRWVREQARASREVAPPADMGSAVAARADLDRPQRRRGPLPAIVRERLQSQAIALRERDGLAIDVIATRLGVSPTTIMRWLARRGQEVGFVKVEVVADVRELVPPQAAPVLHAPGGYRVEGLDVAGLAELLRRLA